MVRMNPYHELAQNAELIEQKILKHGYPRGKFDASYNPRPRLQDVFTCNAVVQKMGANAAVRYIETFFGPWYSQENKDSEGDLWEDPACPSLRVLMLAFAAAMHDTGDL